MKNWSNVKCGDLGLLSSDMIFVFIVDMLDQESAEVLVPIVEVASSSSTSTSKTS